jgi:hypothetical protein
VLHRSRETRHTMTAAVATRRADLDLAPVVARVAPAVPRIPADAGSPPVDTRLPHASRAGTA